MLISTAISSRFFVAYVSTIKVLVTTFSVRNNSLFKFHFFARVRKKNLLESLTKKICSDNIRACKFCSAFLYRFFRFPSFVSVHK